MPHDDGFLSPGAGAGDTRGDVIASITDVVTALEITALPAATDQSAHLLAQARFWELAWSLLPEAALEFRWLGEGGRVRPLILVRVSGIDQGSALGEVERLTADIDRLLRRAAPGVRLTRVALDGGGHTEALPFEIGEGGDLLRKSIDFDLSEDRVDIPVPLMPVPSSLSALLDEIAESPVPVCVSLAAGPTHIDSYERELLEGELARLERHMLKARRVPDPHTYEDSQSDVASTSVARVEAAAVALAERLACFKRLGMLRISIASAGPMPHTFRAAAQVALGWTSGALEYLPAIEPSEREAFRRNMGRVTFEPWGLMVEVEEGRRTVSDCYLASLPEIASSVWFPPLRDTTETSVDMVDPPPRAVPAAVPRDGMVIGTNRASAEPRPVALSDADRSRHMYILGQTGTGKSTLAAHMALHDIRAGEGVCVIDPHGDLIDDILDRFPPERADDLVVFDPRDEEYPLGLNLFETRNQAEKDFAIQQVIGMLHRLYDPHHQGIVGPRFEHMLRAAALTVMAQPGGGTFLETPLLFTSPEVRDGMLEHVTDPVVRSFWLDEQTQTSDFHKSEMLGWFIGKWGAFLSNATMRRILGQRRSGFDMRALMDERKVLLVKLAKGQIGEINAMILGMILVSKLQMAALSRADVPPAERHRFNLYVDEFQSLTLSTFDEMVAEARKYGLALTLMNQHVRQLPEHLRMALFGNVGTLCVFRLGVPDARLVAEEFEQLSVNDFVRLENYRAILRSAVDGRVQSPFDVHTKPPEEPTRPVPDWREELLQASRTRYGTPADEAERDALRIFGGDESLFHFPV